ncbi:MAG: TIGR01777 family oxidoreductase [Vicingaceae bacterium]|nr:TIGR01777 family oxidoreductase [Vicingaceae bacterium]
MKRVLIAGGSGMVGTQLKTKLLEKGYKVSILGRSSSKLDNVNSYLWNIHAKTIDEKAITSADYIINLAGAGIADSRWTTSRKEIIISSRVDSTELLIHTIKKTKSTPKVFISASAVGYYGATTSDKIFNEEDLPGNDFLSKSCQLWEDSSKKNENKNIRQVTLRIGIVLSDKGGALVKMITPFKFGLGSAIATGKQYMPWIHIDDLCNIFIKAIEDEQINGTYNAVSPNPTKNNEFSKILAKTLNKPYWLPNIPKFTLKIALGEMAIIITEGSRVSSKKLLSSGFKFEHPSLKKALNNLFNNSNS